MRERRKNFRVEWNCSASMYDCRGHFIGRCIVSNFSSGGVKISGVDSDAAPDKFMLRLSPRSSIHECHVAWRSKNAFGVEFTGDAKRVKAPKIRDRQKGAVARLIFDAER